MEAPGNSSKLRSKQQRNKRQKNGITSPGTMRQACIHKNNTWEKKASGELEMCVCWGKVSQEFLKQQTDSDVRTRVKQACSM